MHLLIEELLDGAPVLTDGAWGTELQIRGLAPGECPDLWNLTYPQRVYDVAHAYVTAGSDVILTNTFGANRFRLDAEYVSQVAAINQRGVEISRQAAKNRASVFASVGPSGKMLANGDVTEAELEEAFAEQTRAIAKAGADAIVIETMSDLAEASIAIAAARETKLPVIACVVFDSGAAKDRTMMGDTPEQVVAVLTAAGADVIGANCGQGIAGFIPICKRFRAVTKLPIWMKANAGLPEMKDGSAVYTTTPQQFADRIPDLLAAGADFVGGCCGTNPNFIHAVGAKLKLV
ncbi:MAG: homocysteine S-methyltransferase family protein [Limisphaerales bacterium]